LKTVSGASGDGPVADREKPMAMTHLWLVEEMGRLALAERLADAENRRLARQAQPQRQIGRSLRGILANALRTLGSRLDREVSAPRHAERELARIV